MRRRKTEITLEEIVDDIIYFSLSAFIATVATFIFDIHWSFYQDNLFPLKFIFKSKVVYVFTALVGGILGLIWIKLFLFAVKRGTFKRVRKLLKFR